MISRNVGIEIWEMWSDKNLVSVKLVSRRFGIDIETESSGSDNEGKQPCAEETKSDLAQLENENQSDNSQSKDSNQSEESKSENSQSEDKTSNSQPSELAVDKDSAVNSSHHSDLGTEAKSQECVAGKDNGTESKTQVPVWTGLNHHHHHHHHLMSLTPDITHKYESSCIGACRHRSTTAAFPTALGRRPIFVTLPFWELFQPPANVYPWEFEASFVAGYPSRCQLATD